MKKESEIKIFIDIGSTNIKIAIKNGTKFFRSFISRNYEISVGNQVKDEIKKLKKKYSFSNFRISSSANGGLRVGLISMTKRYSGEIAKRIILQAGCNIIWHISNTTNTIKKNEVDVIVISGGLNVENADDQKSWINQVLQIQMPKVPIIFCGNIHLQSVLKNTYKDVVLTENIIEDNMIIKSDGLKSVLRELYLLDLVQKDGISTLQEYSEIPIWPTPAVCDLAYQIILENKSKFRAIPPLMMIDMGGATTDVFYGRELIINLNQTESQALSNNRYVFSSIGIKSSRDSSLFKLNNFDKLYNVINCFSDRYVQKKYLDLKENRNDWIGDMEMFYLCFGLVLQSLKNGNESGHRIELGKVSTLIITGGASQICKSEILDKIYSLFIDEKKKRSINILMDKKYEIWNIGISSVNDFNR